MIDPDYVTLALVRGVGPRTLELLLRTFGSAERSLNATVRRLASLQGVSDGTARGIAAAVRNTGSDVCEAVERLGGVILIPSRAEFPAFLREIPDPPPLLFAKGRTELLHEKSVALVGSRDHTRYGEAVCRRLARAVAAAGLTVVSGMARGLDAVAHEAALDVGGNTVGVLGNGLGVVYPRANRRLYERVAEAGCLITEFPPDERPTAGSFPRRNRLISGLCRVTVVIEGQGGSGALITANSALSQGREVMAVPGPITSAQSVGTNRLLQLGAKVVVEPRDILEEYELDAAPSLALPRDLTPSEAQLLTLLGEGVELVDELIQQFDGVSSEALAGLTALEIRGLIGREPGRRYRLLSLAVQDSRV